MLKGEKIMKERLGFFEGGNLIMRSPWYGIITKVTKAEDGALVAEQISYKEYQDIAEQVEGKKDTKRKILIIFGMIIFYFLMINIFYKITKDIKVIGTIFIFVILGSYPLFDILNDFTYATINKEKMQYAYLFKKLEECYIQKIEINEENLKKQGVVQGTFSIGTIVFAIVMSIVCILVKDLNPIIQLIIPIITGFIVGRIFENPKVKKILIKLKAFLVYRKPTEEQIDTFLFAHQYLNQEEENVRRNYEF